MGRVFYTAMNQRPLPEITITELERFCSKFTINKIGCWPWISKSVRTGYGRFYVDGSVVQATRLIRQLIFGDVKVGKVVDHLCRDITCVNPKHLEVVTQAENIRRAPTAMANINRLKIRCRRGHILAGSNLKSRPDKYRECKACHRIACNAYNERKRNDNTRA